MTGAFKPVAIIMLLAFISPGVWGLSNCMGNTLQANRCQPSCPMMEMSDEGQQVSASSMTGYSCCKVSSGLPATGREAFAAEKYASAILPPVSATTDGLPAPAHVSSTTGTAPPARVSSQQALLCVFLV